MAREHLRGAIARGAVLIESVLAINQTLLGVREHHSCRRETALGDRGHDQTGRQTPLAPTKLCKPRKRKKAAAGNRSGQVVQVGAVEARRRA